MKKGNIIVACIFSAFAIFVIYLSLQLPPSKDGVPGPGTWPILISIIMLGSAITIIINALRNKYDDELVLNTSNHYRVYITMGLLILYLFLMYYIGFFVASVLILYVLITWFGNYKLYIRLISSISVVTIVYLVFTQILNVPFRFGLLF
jgi:putative tricarboxylic transport membrane protein